MAPRSTTKTTAKPTGKAAKPATGKKGTDAEDPDVLVAEITEISALIAHHVPNKVKALTALRDLLSTLAEGGDDVEDAEEDGDEDEDEAPTRTTASAKGKGKGKQPDPDEDEDAEEDGDEDEEEEEDESLSAFPELTTPKEVAAFLSERGIDLDSYDLPAKGAKRTSMAIEIVEGLAATIESAEADKLVVKGKKSVIDKLVEMLDEAGGSAPKRLKKHTDLMYAWMLADAINSAEAEEGDEDEEEDE